MTRNKWSGAFGNVRIWGTRMYHSIKGLPALAACQRPLKRRGRTLSVCPHPLLLCSSLRSLLLVHKAVSRQKQCRYFSSHSWAPTLLPPPIPRPLTLPSGKRKAASPLTSQGFSRGSQSHCDKCYMGLCLGYANIKYQDSHVYKEREIQI